MTSDANATPAQRAILDHLKKNGPSEVSAIAATLNVTTMAVRQHLHALENLKLVEFVATGRSGERGRPSKRWQLLDRANAYFSDAHADLSVELITNIREIFGERGLEKLIERRTEQQSAQYKTALSGANTLRDTVKRLAKLRTDAGYLADVQAMDDGFLLIENHCPVCRAARACTGLCRQELEVFQSALGKDVLITRSEYILSGGRRCAYHIRQKKP